MSKKKWYQLRTVVDDFNDGVKEEQKPLGEIAEENKQKTILEKWGDLKPINLSKIEPVDFDEDKVYPIEYKKKQIVLHHTVSNPDDEKGDLKWWMKDKKHIATCMIITGDGVAHQLFSSRFWSHHIGLSKTELKGYGFDDWSSRNVKLNQESISIEIDNWGGLTKFKDGVYKTVYGNKLKIDDKDIQYFPNGFRGYKYYQKYTDEQIKTVGELLLYWSKVYGISLEYHEDMWDISKRAIGGKEGIWTHVSYRKPSDKQDCFPQTELIDMLKTISKNK